MRRMMPAVLGLIILLTSACICLPEKAEVGGDKIALIRLEGVISEEGQFTLSPAITPERVSELLERAAEDEKIKAVVLRINSPGGSAAASWEIARMIKDFQKPIVVSMGDTATSGGLYISVYADKIIANPNTITGSIGVLSEVFIVEGLLEKLGIEAEVIKSGEHKDMIAGLRPLTPKEREILQRICDELHEEFVRAVAEGRKMEEEEVRRIATGEIFTGRRALELGLVDELGGLEEAIEAAADLAGLEPGAYEVEELEIPWWERMFRDLFSDLALPLRTEEELLILKAIEGWNRIPRY